MDFIKHYLLVICVGKCYLKNNEKVNLQNVVGAVTTFLVFFNVILHCNYYKKIETVKSNQSCVQEKVLA